jgi:hypothetical protein
MRYKKINIINIEKKRAVVHQWEDLPNYEAEIDDIKIPWSNFYQFSDFALWREHYDVIDIFEIIDIDQFPYNESGDIDLQQNEYIVLRFRDKKTAMLWKLKYAP